MLRIGSLQHKTLQTLGRTKYFRFRILLFCSSIPALPGLLRCTDTMSLKKATVAIAVQIPWLVLMKTGAAGRLSAIRLAVKSKVILLSFPIQSSLFLTEIGVNISGHLSLSHS